MTTPRQWAELVAEEIDRRSVDGLLVRLHELGVPAPVSIESDPRPHRHGHHVVSFVFDGRHRIAEGYTVRAALRKAVRDVEPPPPRKPRKDPTR